jgi:hypothetical protein
MVSFLLIFEDVFPLLGVFAVFATHHAEELVSPKVLAKKTTTWTREISRKKFENRSIVANFSHIYEFKSSFFYPREHAMPARVYILLFVVVRISSWMHVG